MIICTRKWSDDREELLRPYTRLIKIVPQTEISRVTGFTNPQPVLLIAELAIPPTSAPATDTINVMLDDVQDPGNLGTIIRACDWFGVKKVFCSEGCADTFNPKVVQAAMGSVGRIPVYRGDLLKIIQKSDNMLVYGAVMDGAGLYDHTPLNSGFLIIGNESKGISRELQALITQKITIPAYGSAESLNAAMACTTILSHIRCREHDLQTKKKPSKTK